MKSFLLSISLVINFYLYQAATNDTAILRNVYEKQVEEISAYAEHLEERGYITEQIAYEVHWQRRHIGKIFKSFTPEELREKIRQRNIEKYDDEYGPTIEWLRAKGKTWEEIIDSADEHNGSDLGL